MLDLKLPSFASLHINFVSTSLLQVTTLPSFLASCSSFTWHWTKLHQRCEQQTLVNAKSVLSSSLFFFLSKNIMWHTLMTQTTKMASIKVKPMHKGAKMVLENFSTQIADTFSTEVFGRMMLGMDLARLSLKMAISRPKDIGKTTGMQAIPVKLTLRKNFFLLSYKLFAKELLVIYYTSFIHQRFYTFPLLKYFHISILSIWMEMFSNGNSKRI